MTVVDRTREFDRRFLLKSAAAGVVLSTASCTGAWRSAAASALPTQQDVWDQQLRLNDLGARYTGNPAHDQFVDWLGSEFESMGLRVASDDSRFTRWSERAASLSALTGGKMRETIEVASTYPYSAPTPPAGIEAPLVYGGLASNPRTSGEFAGRIVYLEAPAPALPFGDWYADPRPYGNTDLFPSSISHAAAQVVTAPDLSHFAKQGALGVVLGWTNISEEQAKNQYVPFNRPMQTIPGVWVGPNAAAKLKSMSLSKMSVRLSLDAEIIPNAVSRTIYAELPGATPELLIVNTHTDGPNAVEENGPIGILALARRLVRLPIAQRQRSILFVLASGHFVGPQLASTDGFVRDHPELMSRVAAALTVEHLGAMEWADQPGRGYSGTGRPELSYLFTQDERLAALALAVGRSSGDARGAVARPKASQHFFGEGRPLSRAGVPTIGFIPVPSYLLSGPKNGHIDKLSPELMYSQIRFLSDLLDRLHSFAPQR